jgi:AraC-like DNA-binding protein
VAHAIAQMLRDGRAEIDLPLSALHEAETRAIIRILRLREDPRLRVIDQWPVDSAAELSCFVDGRSVMFAAVGEVKASGDTAVLTVTLLQTSAGENAEDTGRSAAGLQKWRLKRVIKFIEERLAGPILLNDLAEAAGLSPTYFGAQFRAATGLRPHEYVLRRRVRRAQELLLVTNDPVVEIALSVGFQTQAHFTAVFSRFVGDPPAQWRRRRLPDVGRA